jgi:hypothetical protein
MNLHLRNFKHFEDWFINPKIMDICRCNRTDKREIIPIDQNAQFIPVHLYIAIIADRSPFCMKRPGGVSAASERCAGRRASKAKAYRLKKVTF